MVVKPTRHSVSDCDWMVLEVTILLSLTVFLNQVGEAMPPTSDAIPLIGRAN